ncbi:manganese efflux pump MntP [Limisalsivibrio acetivorans]|uniref:manganese efflux pump MntP n=1 Tax=Limisalsivibrio acetivorans TaxID=1304888 RepID=UPI0003B40EFD|nr:manganese efflux pump MntP family protein [Limisalsivibrio acetivorans]
MGITEIILVAIGLSMDAFAVSVGCGAFIENVTKRHVFRLSFHFGLFQGFMPVIGWAAGKGFASYIESWSHWVAFLILAAIGAKALKEAFSPNSCPYNVPDPSRGLSLVFLSVATSIDALAAGVSVAAMGGGIILFAVVTFAITAGLSAFATLAGNKVASKYQTTAEIAGGLILILIGLKILLSHYL